MNNNTLTGWSMAMFFGTKSVKTAWINVKIKIAATDATLWAIAAGNRCDEIIKSAMNASPNQPKINDVSVIPTCAVDRYSVMWLVMLMACVKFDDGLLRASCNARKADGRTLTSEYSVSVNKTANNKITTRI